MPRTKVKADVAHIALVRPEKPDLQKIVIEERGYFRAFNDISDELIPRLKLDAYEQAVLYRLYRLSFGWNRVTCEVGYTTLAQETNISYPQIRRTIASLKKAGLIEEQGRSSDGTIYRVLPGIGVPSQTRVSDSRGRHGRGKVSGGSQKPVAVIPESSNKDKEKDTNKNSEGCSRCFGTGWEYRDGTTGPVRRCKCQKP